VSRRQLLAAGLSRGVIDRLVHRQLLFPMQQGVFAVGHPGPVELGDATAALLAAGPGAVLSHHTAAALWDIRPTDSGDGQIHVTVPEASRTRAEGFSLHRARTLKNKDIQVRDGLPVTSPARTLLDLAPLLAPRQLELAFDRALVARIIRPHDLAELLRRAKGKNGTPALAALLGRQHGSTVTRSQAEELFLELLRSARLPTPRVNIRQAGYEVDFLWTEQRVVVEIDGYRFHSTRRAFEHDHRKDRDLLAAGLTVLRFTYDQLRREPEAVIAAVAFALGAASASRAV
jgi:very-short-patch-repair endonuclease